MSMAVAGRLTEPIHFELLLYETCIICMGYFALVCSDSDGMGKSIHLRLHFGRFIAWIVGVWFGDLMETSHCRFRTINLSFRCLERDWSNVQCHQSRVGVDSSLF